MSVSTVSLLPVVNLPFKQAWKIQHGGASESWFRVSLAYVICWIRLSRCTTINYSHEFCGRLTCRCIQVVKLAISAETSVVTCSWEIPEVRRLPTEPPSYLSCSSSSACATCITAYWWAGAYLNAPLRMLTLLWASLSVFATLMSSHLQAQCKLAKEGWKGKEFGHCRALALRSSLGAAQSFTNSTWQQYTARLVF